MTIDELKIELKRINVPKSWYLINDGIKTDAHILNKVYSYWEYFYFDEKGTEQGYIRFDNEAEACAYLHHILVEEMERWAVNSADNRDDSMKKDLLDKECSCNMLDSCDIVSLEQLRQINNFFNRNIKNHIFYEEKNKQPFYEQSDGNRTIRYIAKKWYRCKLCGCLWELNYSDIPLQGFLRKFEDGVYKKL